ncbi:MAG: GlsB/YeaQ/YmgE family stress response membrane protein [Candidatus Acidiferrales bacterium]
MSVLACAILLQQSQSQTHYFGVIFAPSHSLIWWIVIGMIAGWLAGTVARGRGFGCLANVILGLVGAVIGGWIFQKLGIVFLGFFGSLAAATVGAIVLVSIARLFSGSRDE